MIAVGMRSVAGIRATRITNMAPEEVARHEKAIKAIQATAAMEGAMPGMQAPATGATTAGSLKLPDWYTRKRPDTKGGRLSVGRTQITPQAQITPETTDLKVPPDQAQLDAIDRQIVEPKPATESQFSSGARHGRMAPRTGAQTTEDLDDIPLAIGGGGISALMMSESA